MIVARRLLNVWVAVAFLAVSLGAASAASAAPSEGGEVTSKPFWFHFLEEYRFRTSMEHLSADPDTGLYGEEESDQTVRLYGVGGYRNAADSFRADLAFGAWFDVDGTVDEGNPTNYAAIYDTSSHIWADVYTLTGEYRTRGTLQHLRLGRQVSEHGLPATFDGLSADISAGTPMLNFFAFGGRTVHFFEAETELFEDIIASAGAVIRPLPSLRLVADYRFMMEDTTVKEGLQDNSYGLTAWVHPLSWLYLKAHGRGINDAATHAGLLAKLEWTDLDLGFQLGADSQLATLKEISELENPYFAILGPSQPHTRYNMSLWKGFQTKAGTYTIFGGWDGRANHEDETPFNRDYGKLYLMLAAQDIGIKGPFCQVALENHFADVVPTFGEEGMLTAGGSAGFNNGFLKAEAGSYYQKFKYNYYQDVNEYEDVRTYFGAFSIKPLPWLAVRARYVFENLDRDQHTVFFSLTQTY